MAKALNNKIVTATKWSAITEIAAKLISPLSTIVLARLLSPESFGVLVTATMVISFAEIFTDAGFQKYIIQKEFKNDDELYKSTSVAFWSNLIFSLVVWGFIALFSSQIAHLVGNDGYGVVITVSCVCIPLAAFSSIQMALFKRRFDFKTLFLVRIVGILIPLVVTIPLAYITRSYWSLIIGMIALNASNAILLTIKSEWKPKWYYETSLFRQMFSFTMWSMFESISIWLTTYLDVFIVGIFLNTYYMGVYRTATSTVAGIMSIITSATTPVLFSALSRLQSNTQEYNKMFFQFQKMVSLLVFPLGVGIFLFSDFVTSVLLGNQWAEASTFIGLWGLTYAFTIVLSHYCSEVYRSKGQPRLSVIAQWLHMIFMVPVVYWAVQQGFATLVISRSLIRLQLIIVNLGILYYISKITPFQMVYSILPAICASLGMYILKQLILPDSQNIFVTILYILLCCLGYFSIVILFKSERQIIISFYKRIIHKL